MPALNDILQNSLKTAHEAGQKRVLSTTELQWLTPTLRHNGRDYLHFSSNDYLGLRTHPQVMRAAMAAVDVHGAGAGASRLITGNHPAFEGLENALANHKKTESALVFGSGYLANIGTISALVGKGDLILADKLVHACMLDGAQLSGATLKRFAHNNPEHLSMLLAAQRGKYRHCLVLTESVFSMDGDVAPLAAIHDICTTHDAWLMVDDAHGIGFMQPFKADIISGTLSKALGSYGGYVAGSATLREYLINHARSFIFATGLPASCAAAAEESLRILKAEPQRAQHVLSLAQTLSYTLGLPAAESAIIPIILGENEAATKAASALRDQGIWVQAIRPPTVPVGQARLRITLTAQHTPEHVHTVCQALASCGVVA